MVKRAFKGDIDEWSIWDDSNDPEWLLSQMLQRPRIAPKTAGRRLKEK